ncbi:MAG: FecR domain-containing protein [Prevotellaceae bacterium]|jgi:ferric-dicitrate binding protein FerR (iron transport regulator)|nr:FecR domain-containing protein [Prevotellaceae bacterium]
MNKNANPNKIDELIAGYFSQGLSGQELNELREWLAASGENKEYFRQMQEVWFSSIGADNAFRCDKERAFQRFLARTAIASETTETAKPRFRLYFSRVAAAAAVLLVFSGVSYWMGANRIKESLVAGVSVEAPRGSRTKLYLPDGTLVWLNAGSTITYTQDFGVKNRNITFEGEAYFEVTKNERNPFVVKTPDLSVHVLGTKFNFRNYADEDEACVTLLEGKVNVFGNLDEKKEYLLNPDQQVVYDKEAAKARITSVKAQNASAWTEGVIFFDEERLPDIVRELERLYNVNIELTDRQLHNYRFYGNFIRTEQTIQEVLDVFVSTGKLDYRINGKEIRLFSK